MKQLAILVSSVFCITPLSAWTGNEVDFPGDAQGWDLGTTNSVKYTGPDGDSEWFRFTFTAGADDGDYYFKMVNGNDWVKDYGGNLIFPKNELALLYYDPLGDSPAKLSGGISNGKRYVFTAKNPGLANTFISVMELSGNPVSITGASRDAGSGLITVSLGATPSPEEKVYIRYTDTDWKYSQVLPANISGTTATAMIPDLKDGRNYQWYAITSTAAPDRLHNNFATDALTLSWNNNAGANYSIAGVTRISDFTVNAISGPYKTTKFFIDEITGNSQTLDVSVTFNAGTPPSEVEVVTNLNRRDHAALDANGDGIEDGILPPTRDLCGQNDNHYYRAYPMSPSGSTWNTSLPVTKTGAYRATVRYRFGPTGLWYYYGDRDHAVVVSPKKTLEMTLYELNPLTIEATSNSEAGRSTFVDLLGSADGDVDGTDPVSLDYFNTIHTNCLWFQPIHPTGGLGVENDPATSSPYVPGSPYATRNFFAVSPYLGSANTEASAMAEFQNFVAKADANTGSAGSINVMLDFVANHTAWDAVLGQGGVDLSITGDPAARIPVDWYSRTSDYGLPATYFSGISDKDIAVAPDRDDFGKWSDVADLHYGRYSALWRYSSDNSMTPQPHKNEDDFMDWNSLSPEVIKLWRYIGHYPEFWLQQTGHPLVNSTNGNPTQRLAEDNKGIDALRCDFGQGLPNGLWEYVINKTRSKKWNFVFMAETLDGAEPGYRSNRVFDILNENMVFNFTSSHVNKEYDIQSNLESRRTTYRTGAILLNITGHDEVLPDNDAWLNASRYGAMAAVPGLPMTFYGQEQGIQNFNSDVGTWHYDGFETDHELNFGKRVPHFKKWNRAQFWTLPPPNNDGMAQWYGNVNRARLNSPAIKALNQYYLDLKQGGGTPADNIFAIAKYEQAGASPAFKDVVLCFANLFAHNTTSPGTGATTHLSASDTFDLRGGAGDPLWVLLGMENSGSRLYNVLNLASSNAAANVWTSPRTGGDVHDNGFFVSLGGGTSNPITNDGELAQFLKVVDVTPPPSPAPNTSYYALGTSITFTWVPNAGPHDNVVSYDVAVKDGNAATVATGTVSDGSNQFTFIGTPGTVYYATITATSATDVDSTSPASSDPGAPNPASATTSVKLLAAAADDDGDGQSNAAEQSAGTNPLSASSVLKATAISRSGGDVTVTIATVPGKTYQLETCTTLAPLSWSNAGLPINATGPSTDFPHPGGATDPKRFYRARVVP